MNSFRVRIFLCCVPAIFATGCPSAPSDPCGGTCDADQVCVNGACVECAVQEDCDDQDACTTDTCAGNLCINAPISCNTAGDCPTGCNVSCNALFFCSNTDPCAGVTCDPNENCVDGTCEPVLVACCDIFSSCADKNCLLPNFCVNGACVQCEITADCDGNGNCPNGSCLCVNGSCVPCNDNNACTSDSRVVDEATVEFVCSYLPFPCATVFECPPACNVACINNFCVGPP